MKILGEDEISRGSRPVVSVSQSGQTLDRLLSRSHMNSGDPNTLLE